HRAMLLGPLEHLDHAGDVDGEGDAGDAARDGGELVEVLRCRVVRRVGRLEAVAGQVEGEGAVTEQRELGLQWGEGERVGEGAVDQHKGGRHRQRLPHHGWWRPDHRLGVAKMARYRYVASRAERDVSDGVDAVRELLDQTIVAIGNFSHALTGRSREADGLNKSDINWIGSLRSITSKRVRDVRAGALHWLWPGHAR